MYGADDFMPHEQLYDQDVFVETSVVDEVDEMQVEPPSDAESDVEVEDEDECPSGWTSVKLLAMRLRTRYGVQHRAIQEMLEWLGELLKGIGYLKEDFKSDATLRRVLRNSEMSDSFETIPMCLSCKRPYREQDEPDVCACGTRLFDDIQGRGKKRTADDEMFPSKIIRKPTFYFPYKSVENSLREFLRSPGNEDDCESWKCTERPPGMYSDIQSGTVWKEFTDMAGAPFFDVNVNARSLEIGLLLTYDG